MRVVQFIDYMLGISTSISSISNIGLQIPPEATQEHLIPNKYWWVMFQQSHTVPSKVIAL